MKAFVNPLRCMVNKTSSLAHLCDSCGESRLAMIYMAYGPNVEMWLCARVDVIVDCNMRFPDSKFTKPGILWETPAGSTLLNPVGADPQLDLVKFAWYLQVSLSLPLARSIFVWGSQILWQGLRRARDAVPEIIDVQESP